MSVPCVVPIDPRRQGTFQFQETCPLTELVGLFFQRLRPRFCVSVPFRVVVTCARLCHSEYRAGLHEGDRCRLTAVITHEVEFVVSAFSAWIWASTGAFLRSTVCERYRLIAIPPQPFLISSVSSPISEHSRVGGVLRVPSTVLLTYLVHTG